MKSFTQIREKTKKMPPGEHVFDKKVGKVKVMVHKTNKGFVVYVDGEKLDTYRSKSEAQRMAIQFAKELK